MQDASNRTLYRVTVEYLGYAVASSEQEARELVIRNAVKFEDSAEVESVRLNGGEDYDTYDWYDDDEVEPVGYLEGEKKRLVWEWLEDVYGIPTGPEAEPE